ncbi:hypothetical protein ACFCV3_08190 [Kribbella sp. NPDC056345]|uniref:hypothetical protein n=1 Tax=Kribbella sp. NPDC056345 TaxID=3345789 RepID=UPI0035E03EC7
MEIERTEMKNMELFGSTADAYVAEAGRLAGAARALRAAPQGVGQLNNAMEMLQGLAKARGTAADEVDNMGTGMMSWSGITRRIQNIHLDTHSNATRMLGDVINAYGDVDGLGA